MLEATKKLVPGTTQVQIAPLVTMSMTIIIYLITEFIGHDVPEPVWAAATGLLIYGLQYWYGPRS